PPPAALDAGGIGGVAVPYRLSRSIRPRSCPGPSRATNPLTRRRSSRRTVPAAGPGRDGDGAAGGAGGRAAALALPAAFVLALPYRPRRISPLAVEMWSLDISTPNCCLIQGRIADGVASLPSAFRARRTASFLLTCSGFVGPVAAP